jgi:transposase
MVMLADIVDVVIGVDTHKDTHAAAVVTAATGAAVAEVTVDTNAEGYATLVALADVHGAVRAWAIEGTSSYGAGLVRYLHARNEWVIEVEGPNRPPRRHGAKTDELDAVRAAREALAREHLGEPRSDGERVALALRLAARQSAVDASRIAQQQLHAFVVTAPDQLRDQLRDATTAQMIPACAALDIDARWDTITRHTAIVMRDLARRVQQLAIEIKEHTGALTELVRAWRPDLLTTQGVGPIVAAVILCAWSHPGRFRSEAAFAMLAGAAPLPSSSGHTVRHRLNRSGDRQLNRALHTIVLTRLRHDPETCAYRDRRRQQGRNDREIKRCLKRYIARQLYRQLEHPPLDTP